MIVDFGLSPLPRGTQEITQRVLQRLRFIPAAAGNTSNPQSWRGKQPVYPRCRGEHDSAESSNVGKIGLSPLARGTLPSRSRHPLLRRFIPAGAGNTLSKSYAFDRSSVYPRWRGEHGHFHAGQQHAAGLSPLARGTHQAIARPSIWARFIPAGAGNTPEYRRRRSEPSVYPRWRGEH